MKGNMKFLYIAALMLSALACGVNTQLPYEQIEPEVLPTGLVVSTPAQIEPEMSMIVTAETLRIRDGAGESFALLGYLKNGQIVTCSSIDPAEDGGQWCKHDLGWSNIRYMKGK